MAFSRATKFNVRFFVRIVLLFVKVFTVIYFEFNTEILQRQFLLIPNESAPALPRSVPLLMDALRKNSHRLATSLPSLSTVS